MPIVENINNTKYKYLPKEQWESSIVYIGRAGRGHEGYFGNPVIVSRRDNEVSCPVCSEIHADGASTLPCYEKWLRTKVEADAEYRQRVKDLKDCTLLCFCKPNKCHGDILSKVCEELNGE